MRSLDGLCLIKDEIKLLTGLWSSVQFPENNLLSSSFGLLGKVQLLAVVGPRSVFSCWFSTSRGCPHSYSICLQSFCDGDQMKPAVSIVVRNVAAA